MSSDTTSEFRGDWVVGRASKLHANFNTLPIVAIGITSSAMHTNTGNLVPSPAKRSSIHGYLPDPSGVFYAHNSYTILPMVLHMANVLTIFQTLPKRPETSPCTALSQHIH